MANKIKYGLESVYYAVLTSGSYGTPVSIPGAVNLSMTAQGTSEKFYADNIPYMVVETNDGYQGDLEVAILDDTARAALLGEIVDENGVQVEHADAVPATFALLYQIQGDEANRRYALYNCTLSRPPLSAKTRANTQTPDTDVLTINAIPRVIDGKKCVKGSIELATATTTVYNGWFTAVQVPDFTPAQG